MTWQPRYLCICCGSAGKMYIDDNIRSNRRFERYHPVKLCYNCHNMVLFLDKNFKQNIIVSSTTDIILKRMIPIFETISLLKVIKYEKNCLFRFLPQDIIYYIINCIENYVIFRIKEWLNHTNNEYLNTYVHQDYLTFDDKVDYLNYYYCRQWQHIPAF